jgi:hypothetical protein
MPKTVKKPITCKIVLRLPDLDHAKSSVLSSLSSPSSRRKYKFAMEQFITWYFSEPRLALNRTVVLRFRLHLESLGLAAGTINQRLAAVRSHSPTARTAPAPSFKRPLSKLPRENSLHILASSSGAVLIGSYRFSGLILFWVRNPGPRRNGLSPARRGRSAVLRRCTRNKSFHV